MLLTLYDKRNNQKMEIAPSDSSTCSKAVQSDNVLSLSFVSYECETLEVNDYIDFCGERFWATDRYTPKQKSTVEWEYDIKLYGIESLIKRYLVVKLVNGDNETEFSYTATAYDHVTLIVQNINAGMETSDWKVGEVVTSEHLTIDYEGTYCDEGFKKVADLTGVEYWIEGTTVNVSRCEHSERITLGYDKGLTSLYSDKADNVKFFTRLFPIGSTRNIAYDTYGHSRLQLPGGVKYIDQDTDKFGVVHHYEKEAFSHIYPRRIGKISNVRFQEVKGEDGKSFTIYYFKDGSLNFNPNEYEMNGLVKMVSFQDNSSLAGRDFEVNYNDKTKEFEIITQWPYDNDIQLPNEQLSPKVLDEYILWNIKMPIEYYALAEAEYQKAVEEFMEKQYNDVSVYKAHTDYIDIAERGLNLTIGQRVRLEHSNYFAEGYRDSRITKITRKVVRPTDMDIEISDVLSKGALEKVDDNIADVNHYTKVATGGFPNILKSWDNTAPTDTNVFSSRKALKESLSRLRDDVAKGFISFLKGINLGEYLPGEQGATIDANGNAEFLTVVIRELLRSTKFVDGMFGEGFQLWMDKLTGLSNLTIDKVTIRQSLVAMELLIEKVRSVGGQFIVSAANGKIKTAIRNGDIYTITFEQANTFVAHDMMRCAVFSGTQMRGYWVEVATADSEKITVPASEFNGAEPLEGDECVLMGNTENPLRQNLILIAATEDGQPRIDILDGVNQKNFTDSLRVRLGALDGINDPDFPLDNQPRGHGLYGDNVFLKGTFVLSTGEDILTRFSVVEGLIQSSVEGLRKDFTEDKSYLDNASFGDGLSKWKTENEATLFRFGAKWLWINNAPLSNKSDFAAIKQDDGRTTVFIKNNYIKQKNSDLRFIPTYLDTNIDGQKLASAVYLLFFYRVKTAGRLRVEFEGLNQAGFEPFNAFSYDGDLEVCDGYKTFDCSGLWNGTGDFKLSFTGEINLYMLILSTDRAEALAYRYKTFFEQSEKLIKIAATNFDKYGNVLESSHIITTAKYNELISQRFNADGTLKNVSGLVTSADFTNLFTRAMSENGVVVEADIRLFITADDAGNLISNATIKADQIELEGLVTANKNFKILEDGSIEAKNADITGKITASDGNIGYFSINNEGLYYGDPSKWSDISYKQDLAALTPGLIRLQSEESYFVPGDIANIKVAIGNGSDPSITGSGKSCYSAGYFYRQMNASSGDWYTPAVKIISDNVVNRDVALYTDGAIVCQGGLLSSGHFNDANSVTVLDFSFGSTVLIYNTAYRYVYLPTLSNMKQLLNSTGVFAVFVRLVARYENNENFKVAFQNGQTSLYFRNNNGAHYGNDIDMGAGDILELLLIYDGGNYYAQVVDRKT